MFTWVYRQSLKSLSLIVVLSQLSLSLQGCSATASESEYSSDDQNILRLAGLLEKCRGGRCSVTKTEEATTRNQLQEFFGSKKFARSVPFKKLGSTGNRTIYVARRDDGAFLVAQREGRETMYRAVAADHPAAEALQGGFSRAGLAFPLVWFVLVALPLLGTACATIGPNGPQDCNSINGCSERFKCMVDEAANLAYGKESYLTAQDVRDHGAECQSVYDFQCQAMIGRYDEVYGWARQGRPEFQNAWPPTNEWAKQLLAQGFCEFEALEAVCLQFVVSPDTFWASMRNKWPGRVYESEVCDTELPMAQEPVAQPTQPSVFDQGVEPIFTEPPIFATEAAIDPGAQPNDVPNTGAPLDLQAACNELGFTGDMASFCNAETVCMFEMLDPCPYPTSQP